MKETIFTDEQLLFIRKIFDNMCHKDIESGDFESAQKYFYIINVIQKYFNREDFSSFEQYRNNISGDSVCGDIINADKIKFDNILQGLDEIKPILQKDFSLVMELKRKINQVTYKVDNRRDKIIEFSESFIYDYFKKNKLDKSGADAVIQMVRFAKSDDTEPSDSLKIAVNKRLDERCANMAKNDEERLLNREREINGIICFCRNFCYINEMDKLDYIVPELARNF